MNDTEAITGRLNAAKPGPWAIGPVGMMRDRVMICAPEGKNYFGFLPAPQKPWRDDEPLGPTEFTYADAEFIASAPTDIKYLLGEVERWHEAALIGLSRESRLDAQRDAALAIHRRGMIYTSGSTDPKHKPSTEFRCTDDHLLWPCATARALGVEA